MDFIDTSGDSMGRRESVTKMRIDRRGRPLAKPVSSGPEAVLHLMLRGEMEPTLGEGCVIWGTAHVSRVAGNMHVALGGGHAGLFHTSHVHRFTMDEIVRFNPSHTIHYLTFEAPHHVIVPPLNGVSKMVLGAAHIQYFIKIVPTEIVDTDGKITESAQYSVTEDVRAVTVMPFMMQMTSHMIPGVFFVYDMSPFMVQITRWRTSFISFLTSVCAMIGGVVTITGILDSTFYHGDQMLRRRGVGGSGGSRNTKQEATVVSEGKTS